MTIDWKKEVESCKDDLLNDLVELLKVKSEREDDKKSEDAPFGPGPKAALLHMLGYGERDGFTVKNVDNYAGHIEYGEGDETLGIFCHMDVVPAGDGWDTDPYVPVIKDNRIYARGSSDDKGPSIAAYYALKIIRDLNLPISKKIRFVVGSDEESGWGDMDYYFQHEEKPDFGFSPDAEFPIINGEKESGVSIMEMVKKMDAGDVCCVKKVDISEEDTMGSLHDKLMQCGTEALLEVIDDVLENKATFVPQDESQVSFAWNISKEEEKIDFSKGGISVYNHIRGLIPSPAGYAILENKKIKFHEVSLLHESSLAPSGEIIGFDGTHLQVSLGDLILLISKLQPEGKAKMSAKDFYNGHGKKIIGKRFE